MLKTLFLVFIGYGIYKFIKVVFAIRKQLRYAQQNRKPQKPFNNVEEADYEVLDD